MRASPATVTRAAWRDLVWDGAFVVRLALLATSLWWAGQLWHPADSLGRTPSYRWLGDVARDFGFHAWPGLFWAWVFTAESAVCAAALLWRGAAVRFATALAVGVVRGVMAWGMFLSDPTSPAWGIYAILAAMAYWLAAFNLRAIPGETR